MTRAKDHLALVTPQRFFTHGQPQRGDRHVYAARTRFIPAAILDKFELTRWPVVGAGASRGRRASPEVRVDLKARMRGMWR
jgi:DNA helicase-2/ATP-dependent DNA helicase PcrA